MTTEEFSNAFTTLLNSYNTQAGFGEQASHAEISLDEYEKSVLLTQAQDIIVKSYFDRTLNPQGQGFDDTPRRQVDFSSLITVDELDPVDGTPPVFDDRGILFQMPRKSNTTYTQTTSGNTTTATYTSTVTDSPAHDNTNVLFILNEKLKMMNGNAKVKEYVIVPITFSEYDRIMTKPYSKPLKKQAWRLFNNQSVGFDVMTELIPRETLPSGNSYTWQYKIRYVRRPAPIILEDLGDLTIDGVSTVSECELNPILHMDILTKAVELAIATRGNRPIPENQNRQ